MEVAGVFGKSSGNPDVITRKRNTRIVIAMKIQTSRPRVAGMKSKFEILNECKPVIFG
jgi:hypothetical protein